VFWVYVIGENREATQRVLKFCDLLPLDVQEDATPASSEAAIIRTDKIGLSLL
jgi:hypothetical protein